MSLDLDRPSEEVETTRPEVYDPTETIELLFGLGDEHQARVERMLMNMSVLIDIDNDGSQEALESAQRIRRAITRQSRSLPSLEEVLGKQLMMSDFGYSELVNSVHHDASKVSATWRELIVAEAQKRIGQEG